MLMPLKTKKKNHKNKDRLQDFSEGQINLLSVKIKDKETQLIGRPAQTSATVFNYLIDMIEFLA